MTWIEVVDTAIKVGLGAMVSGLITYFVAKKHHEHELLKERRKRTETKLIDPIISNLDEHLSLMGFAHGCRFREDGKRPDRDRLWSLAEQEPMILARASSLGDENLVDEYVDFTRTYAKFCQCFGENPSGDDPFTIMKEAAVKAGAILRKLFKIKEGT